ncbi:unnamed protein product, partial [Ixodes hexagonus]
EGPNVECEECGRWCYRMETDFESVAEAEGSSFTCRSCEKVADGLRRIEGEWAATVEEFKRELGVEREKRVQLEAQVGELIRRAEAERAELERQVEELRQGEEWKAGLEEHKRECEDRVQQLTAVANEEKEEVGEKTTVGAAVPGGQTTGDQADVSVRKEAAQLYSTAVQQGPRKAAEVEAVAGSQVAGVNEGPGNGREETGDMRGKKEQRIGTGGQREGCVIIIGDSNMGRCKAAIAERVKGDTRVKVGVMAGQTVGTVITVAAGELWNVMEGRNLVVIAGGLNDILQGRGEGIGKQVRKGVKELREISHRVQIAVCTVPEVQGRGLYVERAVIEANREIRRLGREMKFDVVEVNRAVRGAAKRGEAFEMDGIHLSRSVGGSVGWRLAGRA